MDSETTATTDDKAKLLLRLPHATKDGIRRVARSHNRSMSGEIVTALEHWIDEHEGSKRNGDK